MKAKLLVVGLFLLVGLACNHSGSPKEVSQNFLNALTRMDYEGAKKFGTPETGKLLDMLASFSSMMPDSIKNKGKNVKVEIKDVKENGDKCVVTYRNSEKEEDQPLNLVKKDGKWMVNMTKDETMGAGQDASIPSDTTVTDESAPMADTITVEGDGKGKTH